MFSLDMVQSQKYEAPGGNRKKKIRHILDLAQGHKYEESIENRT